MCSYVATGKTGSADARTLVILRLRPATRRGLRHPPSLLLLVEDYMNVNQQRMNLHGYNDYNGPGKSKSTTKEMDDESWIVGTWMEVLYFFPSL